VVDDDIIEFWVMLLPAAKVGADDNEGDDDGTSLGLPDGT